MLWWIVTVSGLAMSRLGAAVSAAAGSYRIRNLGGGVAKVVKAFVKP